MTAESDIWVLLDDRAGNRAQALGVAERLGRAYREVEIRYSGLAKLPNVVLGATVIGLDAASKASLKAPWPSLVIAAGRRTAPVAHWIAKKNGGKTRLVQIMDPGAGRAAFDLVCRPAHDGLAEDASNIMTIAAAPHRLTADVLEAARDQWRAEIEDLPQPRIALLIGGTTRRHDFTRDMARTLAISASDAVTVINGSLMVTTSRRTGDAAATIAENLTAPHRLYRWDQGGVKGGENPYRGYLALADAVIVTGESVSMCSEAVAAGKPVYIHAPSGLISKKHARLHENLCRGGHARMFDGAIDLDWVPVPLDTAADIADAIRARGLLENA